MATLRTRLFPSAPLLSSVLAGSLLATTVGISACTDGATASCGPDAGCGAGVVVTDATVVDGASSEAGLDASDAGDTGDDAAGDDATTDDAGGDDTGDDAASTSDASDDGGDAAGDAATAG